MVKKSALISAAVGSQKHVLSARAEGERKFVDKQLTNRKHTHWLHIFSSLYRYKYAQMQYGKIPPQC